jgi:hypothetical protein
VFGEGKVKGMDGRLVLTILACCGVFITAGGIASINPAGPSESGSLVLIILAVSTLLFIVIRLILFARHRIRYRHTSPLPTESGDDRAGFFHKRSAILFIVFLAGRFALSALVNSKLSIPGLLIVSLHVLLTVSLGILYSRWAYSEEYVPILAALIVTIADSALYAFNYASNPSRQFRFGPEIFWFAAVGVSGRLMLIPVSSVVIWGSWKLSAPKRAINIAVPPALIGLN